MVHLLREMGRRWQLADNAAVLGNHSVMTGSAHPPRTEQRGSLNQPVLGSSPRGPTKKYRILKRYMKRQAASACLFYCPLQPSLQPNVLHGLVEVRDVVTKEPLHHVGGLALRVVKHMRIDVLRRLDTGMAQHLHRHAGRHPLRGEQAGTRMA